MHSMHEKSMVHSADQGSRSLTHSQCSTAMQKEQHSSEWPSHEADSNPKQRIRSEQRDARRWAAGIPPSLTQPPTRLPLATRGHY
jgi:hypothetical protein